MIRLVSLDHNLTWTASASGTPRRLRQQLKRPFSGTVVAHGQRQIRRQHADQRHRREIMPFDDHLRTDQDIRIPSGKRRQNLFIAFPCAGCIRVHTQHSCLRKHFMKLFFHRFRSRPKAQYIFRTTGRTELHGRLLIPAIMADQPSAPVLRKGNVAVRTFAYIAAGTTRDKSCITAPVQKQHRLLFPRQTIP